MFAKYFSRIWTLGSFLTHILLCTISLVYTCRMLPWLWYSLEYCLVEKVHDNQIFQIIVRNPFYPIFLEKLTYAFSLPIDFHYFRKGMKEVRAIMYHLLAVMLAFLQQEQFGWLCLLKLDEQISIFIIQSFLLKALNKNCVMFNTYNSQWKSIYRKYHQPE